MSAVALAPRRGLPTNSRTVPSVKGQKAAGRQQKMKLTRRGRFILRGLPLLTLLALIVLGAISVLTAGPVQAGDADLESEGTALVQVKAGESLWDIAAATAAEQDTRDVVNEIMKINDLDSVAIQGGQQLEVPVYTAK